METKTFEFEIKELNEEGKFSGYLSVFGNMDAGGDIVDAGAFKKTLREKKRFPLNWGHRPSNPDLVVGSFAAEEDAKGLKAEGEFFIDLEGGKKAYLTAKKLFAKGIKIGLSMGYKTMKHMNETIDGMFVRRLKEVKLREGALTLFPMNELALMGAIKEEGEEFDYEMKPSKDNHTCRVGGGDYVRFRSEERRHAGKPYTVRYGVRKDGKAEEYEYFYPKDKWPASEARTHCRKHDGRFEAAVGNKSLEFKCASCGETLVVEPEEISTLMGEPSRKVEPDRFHSRLEKIAEELKTITGGNSK